MKPILRENTLPENVIHTAIVGAGPYGLSIAAHLGGRGIPFRIFGYPMKTWSSQMPKGMRLKSDGFASSLSDPRSEYTLRRHCELHQLPYADKGLPVAIETFISYGLEFQKRFAPNLEEKLVTAVKELSGNFELILEGGERVLARNVVIAVGIGHFAHMPAELAKLGREFATHSSDHCDPQEFRGQQVAVVGAGSSAIDLAAELYKAGAAVEVLARSSVIRFHDPPQPRSLIDRVLHPDTGLGSGMQIAFYVYAPNLFRYLPEEVRLDRVRKVLGPAPGWFVKDDIVGKVPLHKGVSIAEAQVREGRVVLRLAHSDGSESVFETGHVIAATGYRVDLERLTFVDSAIRKKMRRTANSPALSANFESSVPGLYFVGASAANTFGPLMRFACGAEFASKRVAAKLAKSAVRDSVTLGQSEEIKVVRSNP
jgi:thioredoxin reductase